MEIPKQLQTKGIRFVLLEKGGKKPFQKDWTNKIIEYDNYELQQHIINDGNYGVMGGGEKNIVLVDFDNEQVQEEALKKLPETLTVKTGKGLLHLYYYTNQKPDSFKGFDEDMNTLFDVQGEGKQVVGAGSLHPNGNRYVLFKDKDISFIDYAELKAILCPYDRKPKKEEKKQEYPSDKHIEDNFLDDLKRKLDIKDVLNWIGVDTSKNPTQCPYHNSAGGKCLGFNNQTAHCFHCEGSWNIFSLMTDYKKCSFKEALEILAKIGGMEKELEDSRKRFIENLRKEGKYKFEQVKDNYISFIKHKDGPQWGSASELLVQFIREEKWIYTTKDDVKSEVWIYKEGIYLPQGRSEIKEFLREILEEFYSTYIFNLVMAKIEADTFIDMDKFFKMSYKDEVLVRNGILNIRTLELKDFTPEKIFFNKMPVTFDISAQCSKIDKFLKEVLNKEDDVKVFYELAGFGLLDEYKYEKAFMFHGEGRNGKGKSIELLKRLFGLENCCSIPLNSLKGEDFCISELFGRRLNLAGDIGSQDLKETNMFKSLTGRDLVSAKRKFLRELHFQNYAKFVFACNELPMVYDLTKGFWDRWILLDFPYTFVREDEYASAEDKTKLKIRDDDIITKITKDEEMSGLLNQALLSLKKLEENNGFSTTRGSEEVKTTWIRKSNSFIAFCWDNIADEYDGRISKKMLRKRYSEYCKAHKIPPKSDFVVKKVLQENYGSTEVRGFDESLNIRNDYWEGIRWKD